MLYRQTRLVNLMPMTSGVRCVDDYSGQHDLARFNQVIPRPGTATGAHTVTERPNLEGSIVGPTLKLVMVHLASGPGAERDAPCGRGIVAHYSN